MNKPQVLKVHEVRHGGVTYGAIALVRYGQGNFAVRVNGWCQSIHRTCDAAFADFNARIKAEGA